MFFFNLHFFAWTCISLLYETSLSQFCIFLNVSYKNPYQRFGTRYTAVTYQFSSFHLWLFCLLRPSITVLYFFVCEQKSTSELMNAIQLSCFHPSVFLLYQLSCMIITIFILLDSSMLYTVIGVLYPQFSLFRKSEICTFCMFSLFRKSVICTFCMFLFPTEIHVGVDECDTAGNWTERRRTVVQTRERSTDAGFRCH